jgi:hypothetical protein
MPMAMGEVIMIRHVSVMLKKAVVLLLGNDSSSFKRRRLVRQDIPIKDAGRQS